MNATIRDVSGAIVSGGRRARWLIVAVHIVVIGVPPAIAVVGTPGFPPRSDAPIWLVLALAILGLQLRHSFALARGERPDGVVWTLLALLILVYVPLPRFGYIWTVEQACVMASLPLLLRGRTALFAIATPVIGTDIGVVIAYPGQLSLDAIIYEVCYETITLAASAAALFGSARLARLVEELHETRAELAALAIGRERLRVSRDLHDLLGQSLSAVSLKGDLAMRLLGRDPAASRKEIESLTGLARDAQRGIRAVGRDEHAVSLRTETDGAAALLTAARIDALIDVEIPELSAPLEQMLAWVVREAVANVLRHSQAGTCSIRASRREGNVVLEIVNDGARMPMGEGSGLAGITERARALSGSASAFRTADGRFRLLVEVPEEVA